MNHSIKSRESDIHFIAVVRGKYRLCSLYYDPYEPREDSGDMGVYIGTLDDSIDYSDFKNVSLLQNDTRQSALIMQTRTSIKAQSLHERVIDELADSGTMAKID